MTFLSRLKNASRYISKFALLVLALPLTLAPIADALSRPKMLAGPIPAFVERVVDGDTLVVRARIWLGQELRVRVRISGIDAPEMKSRCTEERALARSARQLVKRLVGQRKISLSQIRQGKYAGRVIAEVAAPNGTLLSAHLLQARLARPYTRGRRKSWCTTKSPRPYRKALAKTVAKTVAPWSQP